LEATLWVVLGVSKDLGTFIIIEKTSIFLGTLRVYTIKTGSSSIVIFRKVNLLSLLSQAVSPVLDYLISFGLLGTSSCFLFLFTIGICTIV
jgi:hypothetical protein